MSNAAIILGAGSGTRMQSQMNKLLLSFGGKTVLQRSVEAFLNVPSVETIVVTARAGDTEIYQELFQDNRVRIVCGGATRQESVQRAVAAIEQATYILIHDGARPFVSQRAITDTLHAAAIYGAAATGVFVKDTIKVVDAQGIVVQTPDRASLFAVQTPQVFRFDDYCRALQHAAAAGKDFTDDCQLIEYAGGQVKMVAGDYTNIKITTPEDIAVAESILQRLEGQICE